MVQGEWNEPVKCPKCKKTGNIGVTILGGAFGLSPTKGEYKCFNKTKGKVCGHEWEESESHGYAQDVDFEGR